MPCSAAPMWRPAIDIAQGLASPRRGRRRAWVLREAAHRARLPHDRLHDRRRTRPRRASAFSSPRTSPAARSTSPSSSPSTARTRSRSPPKATSSASTASSTASAMRSRCARGSPSDVNEALNKPVTLAVYVPDRKPAVHFTGKSIRAAEPRPAGHPAWSASTPPRSTSRSIASATAASSTALEQRRPRAPASGLRPRAR